jgi:hypothetical protein
MQLLQRPALTDETGCQVIQQVGMRRGIGAKAEIARRPNQTGAEELQPDAVDDDASGQRIVGTGNRLGEFEAAAAEDTYKPDESFLGRIRSAFSG